MSQVDVRRFNVMGTLISRKAAAKKVGGKAPKGSVILAMLPDTGERYLSTFLFEGINEGTDEVAWF